MSREKEDFTLLSNVRGGITEEIIKKAEKFGEYLSKTDEHGERMTTTQLRKFYGELVRQKVSRRNSEEGFNPVGLLLLKPKLAYAEGRAKKDNRKKYKISDFRKIVSDAIDQVQKNNEYFENLVNIIQAIVAYHKASCCE